MINMTFEELALRAFVESANSGWFKLHVTPYNHDIQQYNVFVRAPDLCTAYATHQAVGQCYHEIVHA